MKRGTKQLFVVSALVACLVLAACGSDSGPETDSESGSGPIKVGYVASLSGFLAPFDTLVTNGAKLAAKQINSDGGVGGDREIEIELSDNKSDAAVTTTVAQGAIDGGADVLMPPCNADFQVAVASVADREGTSVFSPCNADPSIGEQFPVYFPAGMGGNLQAAAMADFAESKDYENAYILDAPDFLFVKLITQYFTEAAESRGMDISAVDTFSVGETDFASQVTKIQNASPQPDVIVTGMFSPDIAIFAKQLRSAGVDIPILGTDGVDTGLTLKTGGSAVNGMSFTTFGFPKPGSATAKFYKDYEAEYGEAPDGSYAALGYNAIKVLASAVETSGSTDPAQIQSLMSDGLKVQSATGEIVYAGDDPNPKVPVAVVEVRDGAFTDAATLEPKDIPAP